MANLVNPRMEVRILGDEELIITKETPTTDNYLYMDFNITKDREEEPNEANLIIYNLSEASRKAVASLAKQSAPVEIYLTPSGIDELVLAFKGEIDWADPAALETEIQCSSQKQQHRAMNIDKLTFPAGTPVNQIILELIKKTELPSQIAELPDAGIIRPESFSGPAFPLLRRYVQYIGMHCFISDGVLRIASVHAPQNPTVYPIEKRLLLRKPREVSRIDAEDVELKINSEFEGNDPKVRRRRKRKTKKSKIVGNSDYIEYEVVDKTIRGLNLDIFCQPDRQVDDVVQLPEYPDLASRLFRVRTVEHTGDNYGGDWDTRLETDEYEGSLSDLIQGI